MAERGAGVLTRVLVEFAGELRSSGMSVGTGDITTFGAALACLDPADLVDVYWAGRTVLVSKRENVAVFDEVFRRFFLGAPDSGARLPQILAAPAGQSPATLSVPAGEPPGDRQADETTLGLMASDAEILRHKAFASCTAAELAAIRRMMAAIALTPPRRRTRRTAPAPRTHRGTTPDLRRTVRAALRTQGEPAHLYWRRRRLRQRPLILVLDISGSMADYSRNLLQFAYSARRAAARSVPRSAAARSAAGRSAAARVEVFCFGTRLTRITRALDHRNPDEAIDLAARTAFDWDGGTRIGASLDTFVRDWGRRGLARGGIVVICSDGLDRGDPAVLAGAMERLARLSHRIVWLNPHQDQPGSLGMVIAAPHIDLLLSGHDLDSLERLAAQLPALG